MPNITRSAGASVSLEAPALIRFASLSRRSPAMEITAYRMLYDNIHDFKTTVRHVENEIQRHGIRHNRHDAVTAMHGRNHHDIWVSMKTVSHFNLGIAMESMLKLLLFLNNAAIPRDHLLVKLHDKLPAKRQKQLEEVYQASIASTPGSFSLIAFINTASPASPPSGPPNRDISTLRGFLEYFDEDVILWQKRYSWELVDNGRWRHYLSDISVFIALINRVMADIERF